MMRRVAVNLTWIAPGRVGGSEEYLVRQLLGLGSAAPSVEPTLFASAAFFEAHPELEGLDRRVAPLPRDNRGARIAAEHSWLAWRTRGYDVVHHGGGTVPSGGPRPVVVTVHDLQYLEFPQYFGTLRRRYLAAAMPPSVRRAAVVATPSEFVRHTVVASFGIDAERVVVVPHGVPDVDRPAPDVVDAARRRYGVPDGPYVVYPAVTHPHKRHDVLVEMLDHLPGVALVLPGGAGRAESDVAAGIAASRHAARVVRPGRVPESDRDALVAGAAALVFPSEYEGFGAPLVEAMSLGVPVVCSAAPAVCEVVGDAAIVIDGGAPTDWADAVRAAISRRDDLVARGRTRRERFTLDASGVALARAYELAVRIGS